MSRAVASPAARLLAELRAAGFTVAIAEDGRLTVEPAGLDRRLRRLVGKQKAALAALVAAERAAAAEPSPALATASASAADAQRARRREPEDTELIVGYERRPGRASRPIKLRVPAGMSTREAIADGLRGCRPSSWKQVLSGEGPLERNRLR